MISLVVFRNWINLLKKLIQIVIFNQICDVVFQMQSCGLLLSVVLITLMQVANNNVYIFTFHRLLFFLA